MQAKTRHRFHPLNWFGWQWRNIPAAAGVFLLGFVYYSATQGEFVWGSSQRYLGLVAQIESIAIFSFPFLGLLSLVEPDSRKERYLQWGMIVGLLAIYGLSAWSAGGWLGIGLFVVTSVVTYLGYLLNVHSPEAIRSLFLRFLFCLIIFLVASDLADMPDTLNHWNRARGVLEFGMIYFLTLGVIELTGIYQSPAIIGSREKNP